MNHKVDGPADHWQRVYSAREVEEMSWTETWPEASISLIERAEIPKDSAIVDIGGGASRLAHELLKAGYRDISVADISPAALERAKAELGPDAERVAWIGADVRTHDFARRFDLWHDRAVLHFMVDRRDRDAYLATLERSLEPDGRVILATFGPDGPVECSGLPVERYDAEALARLLGRRYELTDSRIVEHLTPSGKAQQFTYALLTRSADPRGRHS
ncbi:MAG: class I SAM-dependent methyltransferase [Solirubrobacterales bacterium]